MQYHTRNASKSTWKTLAVAYTGKSINIKAYKINGAGLIPYYRLEFCSASITFQTSRYHG